MADYLPEPDGRPDPGEACWAWVPYEDDPTRGKDRPVLVIGVRTGDDGDAVVDRLVLLRESDVRREGAALDAGIYAEVLAARAALG